MTSAEIQEKFDIINSYAQGCVNYYPVREIAAARVRCEEEAIKEQIRISAAKMKAEVLADVASRRELQKLRVQVTMGQRVKVFREQFGGNLTDEAEFSVISCYSLICKEKEEDRLLYIQICGKTAKKIPIFLCYRKMDDRYINKKFNAAGVRFGFSYEKEVRVRKLLVEELVEIAPIYILPASHGWYRREGEPAFAFPEMQTWEEFERYV